MFGIRHHFSLSMLLEPTRPPSEVHLHPILDLDGEHPISISLAFTHLSAITRGHSYELVANHKILTMLSFIKNFIY